MSLLENGKLLYIDIGNDETSELVRWVADSTRIPRLDIITARSSATEKYYKRIEKNETRTVFKRDCDFVYVIAGKESVQYQMLEAILDQVIEDFIETYGKEACYGFKDGMNSLFSGYVYKIPEIIEDVESNRVKWVRSYCRLCNTSHRVCVKKSLIENAENYPVSLVYFHQGHGVLLHIDANFKVRGTELVNISA